MRVDGACPRAPVAALQQTTESARLDGNLGASARPGARREDTAPHRSPDGAPGSGTVAMAAPFARGGGHTPAGKSRALQQTKLGFSPLPPATQVSAVPLQAGASTEGGAAVRDHVNGSVAAAAHSDHESDVGNAADDKVPPLAARQEGTEPR